METLRFSVTQEDIDEGVCASPMRCPIARALKRVTKEKDVTVGAYDVFIGNEHYMLSDRSVRFVGEFDHHFDGLEPFEDELFPKEKDHIK